jgi:hypothetical protein
MAFVKNYARYVVVATVIIFVLPVVVFVGYMGWLFFSYLLEPYLANGRYGYIDATGKLVIPCHFRSADAFSEGLAYVENDKRGFINKAGKYVITLPNGSPSASRFSDGLATINHYGKNSQVVYINKTGQPVLKLTFEMGAPFSNGRATLWGIKDKTLPLGKREVQSALITKTGTFLVKPSTDISLLMSSYSEGLMSFAAPSKNKQAAHWLHGFMDLTGKVVIQPKFSNAQAFHEGLAAVKFSNDLWGFIDKKGRIIVPGRFNEVGRFSEGLARVVVDRRHGFIDKTGKYIIEPTLFSANDFSEGLAAVIAPSHHYDRGYINKKGDFIIQPAFDVAEDFHNGRARISYDYEHWGYIDKTGKVVIEPKFTQASDFSEGLAVVGVGTFPRDYD